MLKKFMDLDWAVCITRVVFRLCSPWASYSGKICEVLSYSTLSIFPYDCQEGTIVDIADIMLQFRGI